MISRFFLFFYFASPSIPEAFSGLLNMGQNSREQRPQRSCHLPKQIILIVVNILFRKSDIKSKWLPRITVHSNNNV